MTRAFWGLRGVLLYHAVACLASRQSEEGLPTLVYLVGVEGSSHHGVAMQVVRSVACFPCLRRSLAPTSPLTSAAT